MIHPHNGIVFLHERSGIPTHATMWMNIENIALSGRRQSPKASDYVILCIYEMIRISRSIDTGHKLLVAKDRGERGMRNDYFWVQAFFWG